MEPGLGVYRLSPQEAYTSVLNGLKLGYRHLDTAELYRNEAAVQTALQESKIDRDHIHLTTKLWATALAQDAEPLLDQVHERVRICDQRIDCLMFHVPCEDMAKKWSYLHQEVNTEKVRHWGVSNCTVEQLQVLEPLPWSHQFELSPFCFPKQVVQYCAQEGIRMEAHSALSKGQCAKKDTVIQLSAKYSLSWAQVMTAWSFAQGALPLVRSKVPSHLAELWHFSPPAFSSVECQPWSTVRHMTHKFHLF